LWSNPRLSEFKNTDLIPLIINKGRNGVESKIISGNKVRKVYQQSMVNKSKMLEEDQQLPSSIVMTPLIDEGSSD
jgi:hypothetical protein